MLYYGMDIHKEYSYYCEMDEAGKVLGEGKIPNTREAIREVISPGAKVGIEATCNWYYLFDLIEERADEVILAHPLRTRAIAEARIKTDKIDATTLAHLLRASLLPKAYISPRRVREERELFRYRASLVGLRTSLKNKVHGILLKRGLSCPYKDAFGKAGRVWLRGVKLEDTFRQALDGYLELIEAVDKKVEESEKEIEQRVKANPQAMLLDSLPGVGYYTALLIVSEIGEISRFPDSSHLASYAGLVPSVHSSGGKTRYGHITKEGSAWLRWALIEAAHGAVRSSAYFRSYHDKLARRRGDKRAIVGVARRMVEIIYAMLRDNKTYEEKRDTSLGNMAQVEAS